MSSASCKSRKLMIFTIPLLIVLIINISSYATAQTIGCATNGGYTINTTFDRNLQNILSNLTTNLPDNGYYTASIIDPTKDETITAFALCRGDLTPAQCRTCVQFAAPNLYEICRSHRQGVLWSIENCMVRYIDATLTLSPPLLRFVETRPTSANFATLWREDRDALLSVLRPFAATGGSRLKVAAGGRRTASLASASRAIYGLVQCRPDLSSGDCGRCLEEATAELQRCCTLRTWVRVVKPDCSIQYEAGHELRSTFYNETRLRELGVLLPMWGRKKITSKDRAYYIF